MLYKYKVYYSSSIVVTITKTVLKPLIGNMLLLVYNLLSSIASLKLVNLDLLLQT